jgi:serine/threonine-protein kinase TNNI3K
MAPEVGKNMGYNMGVDVYSLAIIMYEVISLKVPFGNINTPGQLRESVFENGLRPPIDQGWPLHFQSLLRQMWDADPKARPKSGAVHKTIEKMLRGRDTELFPIQMFSTYSDT